MKRYIIKTIIPLLLSLCIVFPSCSGWLEEDTRADNITDKYYEDLEDAEAGLVGVYAGFRPIYNVNAMAVGMAGTDETYITALTSNAGPMDQYTFSANTSQIDAWYSAHFDIIQRANIVISRTQKIAGLSETDLARILGEARFLRAWSYFRLVQTFGRLPLVLEETDEINYNLKREPIEDIYTAIIEDLKFASDDGILKTVKDGGRVNHWAAKALLARVYLTLGSSLERDPQPVEEYSTITKYTPETLYDESVKLCDDIIANGNFSLVKNYRDIFLISNKNINSESIWEIQFSSEPGYGSPWSKQYGVYGYGTTSLYTQNAVIGTATYKAVPSFWRFFKLGDNRRTWSIADWSVQYDMSGETPVINKIMLSTQSIDGDTRLINLDTDDQEWLQASLESNMVANRLTVAKYRWGTGPDPDLWYQEPLTYAQNNTPNNVISLRYADVLLMRAEADYRLNKQFSDTSLKLVNDIVSRARGVNPETGEWYTEEEMKTVIMKPYEDEILRIQEALDLSGGTDESLIEDLAKAQTARDKAAERLLTNYTAETLTYDELMTQRACELCFEFHRWFDLVRTGTLKEAVSSRITCPSMAPKVNIQDRHYLMPIPQREYDMALDKTLFPQNPGY